MRHLPFVAATAHCALALWLLSALPALWSRLDDGDLGAGLVLVCAAATVLAGLPTTIAVILALLARALGGVHARCAGALARAALRCSPRVLRSALAAGLSGLVVAGPLVIGPAAAHDAGADSTASPAWPVSAAPADRPDPGPSPGWPVSAAPTDRPSTGPSPGWPVSPEDHPDPGPSPGWPVSPEDDGGDAPDREGAPDTRPREEPRTPADDPAPRTEVVVAPGDSLWSIAAAQRPEASATDLARDVDTIHRENRAVIGADPDLILPGSRLEIP